MKTEILISFIWIPAALGGHRSDPYSGMRLTIRWQRHIEAFLERARDVECTRLRFDTDNAHWIAAFSFTSDCQVPSDWLEYGELVELLSGYRVLAVGKIIR